MGQAVIVQNIAGAFLNRRGFGALQGPVGEAIGRRRAVPIEQAGQIIAGDAIGFSHRGV